MCNEFSPETNHIIRKISATLPKTSDFIKIPKNLNDDHQKFGKIIFLDFKSQARQSSKPLSERKKYQAEIIHPQEIETSFR
ncbi:CLUMA_CG000433, isoform A [Clunio marinus]|uniref:CLUMA_CG000433, isoform A n=1 Tax=Clunio marinus TaxID=568069 RepID=A0A1J1HEK5_9DIPT|nr:CLUMA_CG000433, isoform A [Clunio marinus]